MKKFFSIFLSILMVILNMPVLSFSTVVAADAEELPSSVDLSTTIHLPPIANQGSLGSCVSMAVTHMQYTNAYSRYIHTIDPDIRWDPSSGNAAYVFSPRFTFNLGGAGTSWVYDILVEQGTIPQTYGAFNGGVTGAIDASKPLTYDWAVTDGYWEMAQNYRIKTYDQVWLNNSIYGGNNMFNITGSAAGQQLIERIKSQVSAGNVVVTGGYPSRWVTDLVKISNTGSLGKADEYAIPYSTGTAAGGHQVAIIGYDDNITCVKNGVTLKGAFKVANSWGTSWLNDGCVWLMYDALNGAGMSAYSALNVSERTWTMDQVIFVDYRTDMNVGTPAVMASVKLTTKDRDSFSITLTKTDPLTGVTETHTPIMFQHASYRPNYNKGYGFTGRINAAATVGEITVNYDYFTDNLPAGKTIDDYVWGIKVSSVSDKSATVKRVKLIKNGTVSYSQAVSDAVSNNETVSYSLDARRVVTFDLPNGLTVKPTNGSLIGMKGEDFTFTASITSGYRAVNALRVYYNGEILCPVNGVYTFKVQDDKNVVTADGIQKSTVGTIKLNNYGNGFEEPYGTYWMVFTLPTSSCDDQDVFDYQAIEFGTYKYTIRCTIGSEIYDFKPQSYYNFGSSLLFRVNVADQGWFPALNTKYTMKVEFCKNGVVMYRDSSFTVTCNLEVSSNTQTSHTHNYTGSSFVTSAPSCKEAGVGYRYCSVVGCKAITSETLPIDNTAHYFYGEQIVTKNATRTEEGELSCSCSRCSATTVTGHFTAKAGDADGDNIVSIRDATIYVNVLSKLNDTSVIACVPDLTGDERVTIKDLSYLLALLYKQ